MSDDLHARRLPRFTAAHMPVAAGLAWFAVVPGGAVAILVEVFR